MRKTTMRMTSLLTAILLLTPLTLNSVAEEAQTESKEENVYVKLNYDGSKKGVYVVNHYTLTKDEAILDYGDYSNLKDLSSSAAVKQVDGGAKINAKSGELYFQGTVDDAQLPWDIFITYYLDGKEIKADKLAGKSGHLEIVIEVFKNENANSYFFKNFALQITAQLNLQKCKNIEAEGASISNYAKDKRIMYTVLPGNEQQMKLSADVKDFEMGGISINAGAFSLDINTPDLSPFMDSIYLLQSSISQVDSGTNQLKNGVSSLSGGIGQIQTGSKLILDGMNRLNSNSQALTKGSEDMKDALNTINTQVTNFVDPIENIYKVIKGTGIGDSLEETVDKITLVQNEYKDYRAQLESKGLSDNVINALISGSSDITASLQTNITNLEICINELKANDKEGENSQQIENLTNILVNLKSNLEELNTFLGKTTSRLKEDKEFVTDVYKTIDEIDAAMDVIDRNMDTILKLVANIPTIIDNYANSLFKLRDGIQMLYTEYTKLDNGINAYTDGFSQIVTGYCSFYSGITQLNKGAAALKTGATQLNNGTSELNSKTSNMDTAINEQVSSMIQSILGGSNEALPSFVSQNNTKIKAVQFAMTTPDIKKAQKMKPETKEKKYTFWQKFLQLFRIDSK